MPELIIIAVGLGWIVLRVMTPARWQEYGIYGAMLLALVPTMMGLRQDPTVQTVILPMASGLVLGDLLHRLVAWVIVKAKALHAHATTPRTPNDRSSTSTRRSRRK